ncbi:MAG: biopolymer transporter ExbD [Tepidisphaeraceae bacterium]
MKRFRPHDSHTEHPNVIPLVDVFLCLIVFYMLAAKIGVTTGADPDIAVAVAKFGKELDLTGTLLLNVRQDSSGEPVVSALVDTKTGEANDVQGEVQTLDTKPGPDGVSQLDRVLRNLQRRKPDMKIILRTDGAVEYRAFMPVLVSVNQAKIKNIYHNVKPPEGKS